MPISGETPEGRKRRLAASKRGSQSVRSEFASALTRKQFCERVGIHPNTLARWETADLLSPRVETILGSPTRVFDERDIAFGKRLIEILREQPGRFSLAEAGRKAHSTSR